jgi:hypothetical protein
VVWELCQDGGGPGAGPQARAPGWVGRAPAPAR